MRERRTAVVKGLSSASPFSPHQSPSARAAGTMPVRRDTTTVVGETQRTTNLSAHSSPEFIASGVSTRRIVTAHWRPHPAQRIR